MIVKKKRTRLVIVAVIGVVLLATVFSYASPKLRASLFVHAYHDLIEEGLTAGNVGLLSRKTGMLLRIFPRVCISRLADTITSVSPARVNVSPNGSITAEFPP